MIEEYLELAAVTALAVIAITAFAYIFAYITTPAACQAVRLAAENPGSELVAYGRLRVITNDTHVSLCGITIEKDKILIYRTEGYLFIVSDNYKIYIK